MYTETIKQIKETVSMLSLANEYTFLRKSGGEVWIGKCPNPNHKDSLPSFRVWDSNNSWACMGCHNGKKDGVTNYGSDCIGFIMWVENKTFQEAVIFLANKYNIALPKTKQNNKYSKFEYVANKFTENIPLEVKSYLEQRGLTKDDLKKWKIGYDKGDERITFPLIDKFNRVVGFTKRAFYEDDCKYINSSSSDIFNKSSFLYGFNHIDRNFDYIRITEGPMDVIAASSKGAKNVVATLGTAFTKEHAQIIKDSRKTPVLIYDSDYAGSKATVRAIDILNDIGVNSLVVTLPNGMDLCDFSNSNMYDIESYIMANQVSYGYMKIRTIIDEYNKTMYTLKNSISPKISQVLDEVPKHEKQLLKDYIYNELKMGVE